MKNLSFLSTAALVAIVSSGTAGADVIASYDFEAGSASTDADSNSTASVLSNGAGVTFAIAANTVDPSSNSVAFNAPVSGNALTGRYTTDIKSGESLASALGADDYISFTLTTGGNTVDLSSFSFDYQIAGGGASPGAYLLAETTAGTFDATDLIAGGDSVLPAGPANASISFDLTSVADFTADTEFRLYLSTSATSNWGFAIDNVQLEGSVVPEPGSLALMGLGGLLIARRRRG